MTALVGVCKIAPFCLSLPLPLIARGEVALHLSSTSNPTLHARGFHNRDYPRISLERGGIRTHPRHSLPRIDSQARFRQPSRSSLCKGRYWECLFSLCRRWYLFLPRPLLCAFIVSQLRRFVKRFLKISFEKVAGRMRRYTAALSLISPREATRVRASTVRPLSESFFPSGSLLLTPI